MNAPHDTFTHDNKVYDLTKVRILLRGHKAFFLPLKDLTWVLAHDHPDEKRVLNARLRYPLIVAKYKGRWAVVDGLHRLEKYRRRGFKVLPVVEVTQDILKKCLVKT